MQVSVNSFKRRGATIWLNKVEYIGFLIDNIPSRFGFILDAENDREGICEWFNRGGLTYIRSSDLKTGW